MTAIVGAILGHDYGARDYRGGKLGNISITSDGFVTAHSTASDGGGAFLGGVDEFEANISALIKYANLTSDERTLWNSCYSAHVTDWRTR
jgi:hypothetical protein